MKNIILFVLVSCENICVQVPRAGKRHQVQQGRHSGGHSVLPQDAQDGPDQEEPPGGGGQGPGSPEQEAAQQNTGWPKICSC